MAAISQKANVVASTIIDNKIIEVTKNPNAEKSVNEHTISFAGTSNAVFRCFQVLERVTKLVVEALKWTGSSLVGVYEKLAAKFLVAWTSTSVFRLPEVTTRAIKSINEVNAAEKDVPADFARKAVKAVHDSSEAAAMWLYSASFFLAHPAWKTAGDVPDLISNATDLQMNAEDWHLASQVAKKAVAQNSPIEVEKAVVHTQRNSFIKMLKAACSVASGVLGLAALAMGVSLLPAVALITISLSSTIFALMSHFYQETAPYKMIDFFQNRTVQVAPSVAV